MNTLKRAEVSYFKRWCNGMVNITSQLVNCMILTVDFTVALLAKFMILLMLKYMGYVNTARALCCKIISCRGTVKRHSASDLYTNEMFLPRIELLCHGLTVTMIDDEWDI